MRWKPHVRFGGRARETHRPKGGRRALVRPHLANMAIDDVRRRVQQDEWGHRGRKGDPLYGIRRLLLRANERLSDHARFRLEAGLAAGDPRDEVLDTWLAKEALRDMYAADTMVEAARRFDAFLKEAKSSSVPELHRLAKTMSRWRTEILAHHRHRASNGGLRDQPGRAASDSRSSRSLPPHSTVK